MISGSALVFTSPEHQHPLQMTGAGSLCVRALRGHAGAALDTRVGQVALTVANLKALFGGERKTSSGAISQPRGPPSPSLPGAWHLLLLCWLKTSHPPRDTDCPPPERLPPGPRSVQAVSPPEGASFRRSMETERSQRKASSVVTAAHTGSPLSGAGPRTGAAAGWGPRTSGWWARSSTTERGRGTAGAAVRPVPAGRTTCPQEGAGPGEGAAGQLEATGLAPPARASGLTGPQGAGQTGVGADGMTAVRPAFV